MVGMCACFCHFAVNFVIYDRLIVAMMPSFKVLPLIGFSDARLPTAAVVAALSTPMFHCSLSCFLCTTVMSFDVLTGACCTSFLSHELTDVKKCSRMPSRPVVMSCMTNFNQLIPNYLQESRPKCCSQGQCSPIKHSMSSQDCKERRDPSHAKQKEGLIHSKLLGWFLMLVLLK